MSVDSRNRWSSVSFVLGCALVALGAIAWMKFKDFSGWLMAIGGLTMSISLLFLTIGQDTEGTFRTRRLERMQLFSSLLYLVSGGFMIQGSGLWLPIFAAGTVFFVYSTFALSHKSVK